nr:aminotransferase class V-fold PLP-dependent enzyme [Mesorhizobium delmotii]
MRSLRHSRPTPLRFCYGCEQRDGCRSTHWSFDRCRRRLAPEAILHMDATQVVGRIPIDLTDEFVEVDLLSLSAHKFHGPKGVDALYIGEGLRLEPLIYGEQEDGRRGGTLNSAAAAGLAVAAETGGSAPACSEWHRSASKQL